MKALELERKLKQECTRCGLKLGDDDPTSLCRRHQLELNARVRAHYARSAIARRVNPRLLDLSTGTGR